MKRILLWFAIVALVLWTGRNLLKTYVYVSYKVPSGSMLPTIEPGKHVLVNCLKYGARVFDCGPDSVRHGSISRKPGKTNPARNDMMVFNNPYTTNWDTLSFDKQRYFVKRCIALPGDTFEICNGYYRVRGFDGVLGNIENQREVERITSDSSVFSNPEISYWTAPFYHPVYHWNIREMGPLYVPQKGDVITLDTINAPIYKKLIEWEMNDTINEIDGHFYVNGNPFISHTMEQNYYFMAGDNVLYSCDSRYWGLVPEEFIVGKVVLVY